MVACPQLQKGSQEPHKLDKERSEGPVNERSRKGRFPVLFVENQELLWRVKGRNSHLSPEQGWRALLLERDPGNLKARVAVAAPGDSAEACMTPICSPVLVQGLGDAVRPNKPCLEQSSLHPQAQALQPSPLPQRSLFCALNFSVVDA